MVRIPTGCLAVVHWGCTSRTMLSVVGCGCGFPVLTGFQWDQPREIAEIWGAALAAEKAGQETHHDIAKMFRARVFPTRMNDSEGNRSASMFAALVRCPAFLEPSVDLDRP